MLRTNLSTRPFYNVRAVQMLLGAVGIVVLAITVYNLTQILRLTASQRSLGAHAVESEAEAIRLHGDAAQIRAKINPRELEVVSGAAREANGIIDQRAFSWSELFSQFEMTLPADVRVTSVKPHFERDGLFLVAIGVQARRVEDLDAFLEALEMKGAFHNVLATQEQTNDRGLIEAIVEGTYSTGSRGETTGPAVNAGGRP